MNPSLPQAPMGSTTPTPSYLKGHGTAATVKSWVPSEIRVRARTALFRRPALARVVARTDLRTRLNLATRHTELVIDGFHRSANTYAVTSFEQANPSVDVIHHLHSPLAIHEARRFGIPMILLLRNPADAVTSYLQFEHRASPLAAIQMYIAYHLAVMPHLADAVVTDFPETISNFAGVVHRCNERFGTTFAPPEETPEFDDRVRTSIREGWNGFHATPLPSQDRMSSAAAIASFDPRAVKELARATEVYEQVLHRGA